MLPLLVAGGAFVAAVLLSGCNEEAPAPSEPVSVPFPQNTSEENPSENPATETQTSSEDSTQPYKRFSEGLPHSDAGTSLVPVTPCGVKLGSKGMARFPASIWSERGLKLEEVLKVADLNPLGQDRVMLNLGNCPTPIRELLRITQEEFKNDNGMKGIRLANLSLLICFQNKKCFSDESQRIQFAIPFTESLRELYLIDEDHDGTEDLLFTTDGKYSYVLYGEKYKP